MNERWPRTGLYAITPDEPDTARLLERTKTVLGAGATWLQYRNKVADAALRREQATALLEICRAYDVPLIVNDDWRLAADLGAAGAHLGEDDGDLRAARDALGDTALVGASCYDDIELARRAVDQGATYVAFGAFFPSPTKPNARRAAPALLEASANLGVPRVAIGGITPDNAPSLVAAGADLVAVISGVFDAPDPALSVRHYLRAFALPSPAARHGASAHPDQTR